MTDPEALRRSRAAAAVVAALFVATTVQLLVAVFAPDLPQFRGKAFGSRLVAYPLLMALVPASWLLLARRQGSTAPLPWSGFALLMAPFLIDVTGNTLDLYDSLGWWDDVNHLVNWFLLCSGAGVLLLRSRTITPWALGLAVAGLGALLAIGWELAEWFLFIRHGTELGTAYEDTLGDEALGSLGGMLAGLVVARLRSRAVPA